MAAEKGSALAMNNLAYYYENIEKNDKIAKKYFVMAANNGHKQSINRINKMLTENFDIVLAIQSYQFLDKVKIIQNVFSWNVDMLFVTTVLILQCTGFDC